MNPMILLLSLYFLSSVARVMTAVVNVSFWLALIYFLWLKLVKKEPLNFCKGSIGYCFLVLLAVFLLSLACNPDWFTNNLDEFRKDHLRNVAVFVMTMDVARTFRVLRIFLLSVAGGFALRAMLIMAYYWAGQAQFASVQHGYALDATIAFTALMALFVFDRDMPPKARLMLGFALLIQAIPLVLHGSRTPIAAIVSGLILSALLGQYWKVIGITGTGLAVLASLLFAWNPGLFTRYETMFKSTTYSQDGSLLERKGIWWVTSSLVQERPLLGYGPGWRKLAIVARTQGYVDKLAKRSEPYLNIYGLNYFQRSNYGRANPHNLALQIAFEIGLIGLLTYLSFMGAILWGALRLWRNRQSNEDAALSLMAVAMVVSYLLINLTNGLWAGSAILLAMAATLANRNALSGLSSMEKSKGLNDRLSSV